LERVRQSLQFLAMKHKNELESLDSRLKMQTNGIRINLTEIINELESISEYSYRNSSSNQNSSISNSNILLENKLIEQNRELINAIKQLSEEKLESKNMVSKLEEELWSYRNKNKVNKSFSLYLFV
jgi:hypothetical protein